MQISKSLIKKNCYFYLSGCQKDLYFILFYVYFILSYVYLIIAVLQFPLISIIQRLNKRLSTQVKAGPSFSWINFLHPLERLLGKVPRLLASYPQCISLQVSLLPLNNFTLLNLLWLGRSKVPRATAPFTLPYSKHILAGPRELSGHPQLPLPIQGLPCHLMPEYLNPQFYSVDTPLLLGTYQAYTPTLYKYCLLRSEDTGNSSQRNWQGLRLFFNGNLK